MIRVSILYGLTHDGKAKPIECDKDHEKVETLYRKIREDKGQYEQDAFQFVWLQTSSLPCVGKSVFPTKEEAAANEKRLANAKKLAEANAAKEKAKAKKAAEDAKKAPAAQAAAAQAEAKKAETKAKAAEKLANEAIGRAKALENELEESHVALANAEERAKTAEEALAQVGVENPPTADEATPDAKTPPAQSTK